MKGQGQLRRRAADEPLIDFVLIRQWAAHALRAVARRSVRLGAAGAALRGRRRRGRGAQAGALLRQRPAARDASRRRAGHRERDLRLRGRAQPLRGRRAAVAPEALRTLARELHLLERWDATRTPALRSKDALLNQLLGRAPTDADREEALVAMLADWVFIKVDGQSVDIGATFPDKASATLIVETLRQRLLESRRAAELASLEATVKSQHARVETANARVQQTVTELEQRLGRRARVQAVERCANKQDGSWGALPDPRLMELRAQILATRKSITEIETSRSKRLAELNALLVEQQANLADQHPSLIETREKLAALQTPGPELAALRETEKQLLKDFVSGGGRDTELSELPRPDVLARGAGRGLARELAALADSTRGRAARRRVSGRGQCDDGAGRGRRAVPGALRHAQGAARRTGPGVDAVRELPRLRGHRRRLPVAGDRAAARTAGSELPGRLAIGAHAGAAGPRHCPAASHRNEVMKRGTAALWISLALCCVTGLLLLTGFGAFAALPALLFGAVALLTRLSFRQNVLLLTALTLLGHSPQDNPAHDQWVSPLERLR